MPAWSKVLLAAVLLSACGLWIYFTHAPAIFALALAFVGALLATLQFRGFVQNVCLILASILAFFCILEIAAMILEEKPHMIRKEAATESKAPAMARDAAMTGKGKALISEAAATASEATAMQKEAAAMARGPAATVSEAPTGGKEAAPKSEAAATGKDAATTMTPGATSTDHMIVGHPILGWAPAHPGRFRSIKAINGKTIYDVVYTIDDNLLRKTHAGSSGEGIAFLGDSYVFGEGLDDSQTLPQQFADLEGRRSPVFNLGFSGYNVAQALAEMQSGLFDKLLTNTRLFVEFIAPWQSERTSCKIFFVAGAPRYVNVNGKIVRQGVCHPTVSPLTYFAFYRVFVQPRLSVVRDSDIDILTDVANATAREVIEKYKKPIVIYYLRNDGYLRRLHYWTDDKIMDKLRTSGAKVLDYTLEDQYNPKFQIVGDGHPSPLANQIHAKRLFEYLRKEFPEIEPASEAQSTP